MTFQLSIIEKINKTLEINRNCESSKMVVPIKSLIRKASFKMDNIMKSEIILTNDVSINLCTFCRWYKTAVIVSSFYVIVAQVLYNQFQIQSIIQCWLFVIWDRKYLKWSIYKFID